MNIDDLKLIEEIIIKLIELDIMTSNHDESFFLNGLEMNILLEHIETINNNINRLSDSIRKRYNTIPWDIISKEKYIDDVMGESMKVSKIYPLASSLYSSLYDNMIRIVKENIDEINHEICIKRQKKVKQ